jgi:hypothetical protein
MVSSFRPPLNSSTGWTCAHSAGAGAGPRRCSFSLHFSVPPARLNVPLDGVQYLSKVQRRPIQAVSIRCRLPKRVNRLR